MRKAIGTLEHEVLKRLLKTCRKDSGLTQTEVAARLNTTVSRISEYETGERRADLVQLLDLCDVYEIGILDFVARFVEEIDQKREAAKEEEELHAALPEDARRPVRRRTYSRRSKDATN